MKHLGESIIYTLVNILGSFITLIFTFGVIWISENRTMNLNEISGKGEVIIICVPLCFSVIYSLYYNKKNKGVLSLNSIIFWITLLVVLFCTWFYANFEPENVKHSNNLYLFSKYILIWTAIAMFLSKLFENITIDLKFDRKKNLDKLSEKFNALKKNSND